MSFYLLLYRARIYKKFETLNAAEAKFYSFVADGMLSLPELEELLAAADPADKRELVRRMGEQVLGRWESVQVDHVEAGHTFRFGDTGKILYRAPTIPQSLDWVMLVIESDQDVRELGDRIGQVLPDARANSLVRDLKALASTAASPQAAAAVAVAKAVIAGVTTILKGNKNDQLGLIEQSFVRELHYPDGVRVSGDVQDLTGNMWYAYTLFGVE